MIKKNYKIRLEKEQNREQNDKNNITEIQLEKKQI